MESARTCAVHPDRAAFGSMVVRDDAGPDDAGACAECAGVPEEVEHADPVDAITAERDAARAQVAHLRAALLSLAAQLARGEHLSVVDSAASQRSRRAFVDACERQADEHRALAVRVRELVDSMARAGALRGGG